jgi:hypothetical protein
MSESESWTGLSLQKLPKRAVFCILDHQSRKPMLWRIGIGSHARPRKSITFGWLNSAWLIKAWKSVRTLYRALRYSRRGSPFLSKAALAVL